ncbi:nitrogen regulation protein NR(II) [Vitiosangium sp. GDMCC 1.1324]|uniref:two-component system sensor histidine kinase NtrB n=1 Tax=Vitiosangium sp. (strain GDMCC 1.1324) TaxID=2138576 RepID=UPI000D354116|nr:ATP-binding protein [Vitiosangium sp. GDMCC 1.1324]PTL82270.1 two-component sensor histidine kinase [Vitiosangium sp. GDMCC 1.1324]
MTTQAWISLGACAGLLALAGLAVVRVGRSPLALPLSVISIALSTWNFADFALAHSGGPGWRLIATGAALMSAPSAMHFILAFVGERRRLAALMFTAYGVFGALTITALVGLGSERVATAVVSRGFAVAVLSLTAPLLLGGFGLLTWHLRREVRSTERTRAGLLLTGLALLVTMLGTDLVAVLGQDVPRLGNLGTLLGLPAIAVVALRLRLFGQELSNFHAISALLLAMVGVLSYLAVFQIFAAQYGVLVVGTSAITLALLAITRRGVIAFAAQRERLEQMATLGRFSAQMAHDLKNPIAALKGAAQYLKEEHSQGRPWDDKGEFLDLLLEQVERLDRVVSTYQRLGRVEPLTQPLDVNQLAASVLSLQAFTGLTGVEIRRELAEGLPRCSGDWDLLANALENLVRNAFEAMPRGGTLTLRTRLEGTGVVLSVEDTGEGMNARTRERAFDDFYTTKATGSGLGLAFVRRVVEAHGGQVTLTSHEGSGTTVTLRLPAAHASAGVPVRGSAEPWPG